MYYVYMYLDPRIPDEIYGFQPFYVGKGTKNRLLEHLEEAKNLNLKHPKLSKIRKLQKLNLEPIVQIHKEFEFEKDAYLTEKMLIDEIGSNYIKDIKDGPLTNLKRGGDGGGCSYIWTDEKRKHFSEKMKGSNIGEKNGMFGKPSPMLGKTHSPETVIKLKQSLKKHFDENNKQLFVDKPLYMFLITGELINVFSNVFDATNIYTINAPTIISSAKTNGQRISYGFRWSFNPNIDKKLKPMKLNTTSLENLKLGGVNNAKKIAMLDKDTGEILRIFDSCKEAITKTGFKNIGDAANPNRHKSKTAGGFAWKYV